MKPLIKAAAADSCFERLIGSPLPDAIERRAASEVRAETSEALLEAEVAELRAAYKALEASIPEKLSEAREEGGKIALATRSDAEGKRLAAVSDMLERASVAWDERLSSLEAMSILLSRTILEQVFADGDDRAAIVASCLQRKFETLAGHSVISVRVSGEDFGEPERLATLRREVETRSSEILIDPNLKAGDCLIDLQLGQIEVGPAAQWPQVAALLDELTVAGLR